MLTVAQQNSDGAILMSDYRMPTSDPITPSDLQAAVVNGVRNAIRLEADRLVPAPEQLELNNKIRIRTSIAVGWVQIWSFVTAISTAAIAIKLWFFL